MHPMTRAIMLAARGRGNTAPNPMVGAVVVDRRSQEILGQGYHHRAGGPHAEVLALRKAGERARGQALYVTLEPCNHTGRTPPCTEAIIASGIAEVHVSTLDPNPRVIGGGVARLRQAGVNVSIGLLAPKAFELNRAFFCWALEHRPFVVLKSAMSLDGKVATASGQSKYLTHAEALSYAHEQRQLADAILVGVGTVRIDDPVLTYRGVKKGRDPVRVIMDSQGRTSSAAKIFHSQSPAPTLVFTGTDTSVAWEREIFSVGGEVIRLDLGSDGHLRLHEVLHELAMRDLKHLLVEGGPTIHASFIQAGLADQWIGIVAPIILGGSALSAVANAGVLSLESAPKLSIQHVEPLGQDALIVADFLDSPVIRPPQHLFMEADPPCLPESLNSSGSSSPPTPSPTE